MPIVSIGIFFIPMKKNSFIHQKTLGLFVKTKGKLSTPIYGGLGHVFMLHRVLPKAQREEFTINKSLAITPEGLEKWINYFKNKNYEFISMDELNKRIKNGNQGKKRFIVFTLDDGYIDNLTYGLPVFEKYNIPFSIFVTSCLPNKTANYWWYLLENQLLKHNQITLLNGDSYYWKSADEARKLQPEIRLKVKKYTFQQFNELTSSVINDGININSSYQNSLALSWDQIIELAKHPLCTIGGHTVNHLSLKNQSEEDALNEISINKQEIEDHIKQPITHFAYPYGSFNDISNREHELVKKAGYTSAYYNEPGNVFKISKNNYQFKIPRMGLTDETTIQRMEETCNGIFHFSSNGNTKIIC